MRRCILTAVATTAMAISMGLTAFAGAWQQDATGWWWQNDDGSYPVSCWQWIDGNGDGTAESYCFNTSGYMYANTVTPDGYTVNADGAWVVDGVVQTQSVSGTTSPSTNGNVVQPMATVQTGNGTRENPYNAYLPVQFTYALTYFPTYNYTASIQLLEKIDGGSAARIVQEENMFNEKSTSGNRWVLYHFQMSCIASNGREVSGSDIISSNRFYNENSTVGLSNLETATFGKNKKATYSAKVYPGGTDDFWVGLLLDNSVSYTTFKVDTGEGEIWFTTK